MTGYEYLLQRFMLQRIYRHRKEVWDILEGEDFNPICNQLPKKYEKIMLVIPVMKKFSGGCTSVLRLGSYLAKMGYVVRYGICGNQSKKDFIEAAKYNYIDFDEEVVEREKLYEISSDIVIATSWHSVYTAKRMNGYKMYFVQDYEPYFYNYDERYLLAKKTYEMGFHIISLGKWNKNEILKNTQYPNLHIDVIDFPYEKKEYSYIERDYSSYADKKKLIFAVYVKAAGKRIPNIIQYMLMKLKNEFLESGIELEFLFYGEIKKYKTVVGKNLGKLNKKELKNLYANSDFGMSASMTNISLVPYEMIATGLPIIEFQDGTLPYFFEKESAILTTYHYMDLYEKLNDKISNPVKLQEMMQHAQEQIEGLSWEKSSKQVSEIIRNIGKRGQSESFI